MSSPGADSESVTEMAAQATRFNTLTEDEWRALEIAIGNGVRLPPGIERWEIATAALNHVLASRTPSIDPAFMLTALTSDSTEEDARLIEAGWSEHTRATVERLRLQYGYWLSQLLERDFERETDWSHLQLGGLIQSNPDGSTTNLAELRLIRVDDEELTIVAEPAALLRLVITITQALTNLGSPFIDELSGYLLDRLDRAREGLAAAIDGVDTASSPEGSDGS